MEVWGGNHAVDQGVVMPGLDIWVRSEPHEGMSQGGDVHYVSSCGTGRISRMVLADISGHGESVGGLARDLRSLMRRYVNFVDQTRFVGALNASLSNAAGGHFATSIAMTFFAPSRQLDLCNAGHPRPFLYSARRRAWQVLVPDEDVPDSARDRAGDPTRSAPRNLPLGILEPTQYQEFGLKLGVGDLVLAYTDALIESKDPSGALLGEDGLLRMVRSLETTQPERFVPALLGELAHYRGGAVPDDDCTILLLRHNGLGSTAGFFARVLAGARFLGILARHLVPFGTRPPIPWPEVSLPNLLGPFYRPAAEAWQGPRGSRPARFEA